MKSRARTRFLFIFFRRLPFFVQSGTSFAVSSPFFKSRRREKCFDFGANRHREKSLVRTAQAFPFATRQRGFLARVPFIVLYILSLCPPHFVSFALLSFSVPSPRRPFSAPPLLRADPSPRRPSLSLRSLSSAFAPLAQFSLPSLSLLSLRSLLPIRPIRPIRAIRVQKKIIRVQKKKPSDSCANTPSKLSPSLYKLRAKASAIPLKSRKTQIFSNFLSQSLARFRKSPYFCTR